MAADISDPTMPDASVSVEPKRLNVFERYLTLWVALCMVAGVALGRLAPASISQLRGLEFGSGSQINVPIAVLIWLMIVPMMLKIDFASLARHRPASHGAPRHALRQLARQALQHGAPGVALLQAPLPAVHRAGAGRSVHGRGHHPGRGPLHGDGLRLELPHATATRPTRSCRSR